MGLDKGVVSAQNQPMAHRFTVGCKIEQKSFECRFELRICVTEGNDKNE